MVMFQLAFYTDTFGITAAAAGTLLVVVRVWDAIFDPMMGVVADRTKTKWGKFRPWILWTAVPFGIMGFLAFVTPDFTSGGKLVYAYITYIVLMMVYSANNLPYSALSGVMTGDLGERTSLSSYRFVFAMLAQLIIQGLALPMVSYFGAGKQRPRLSLHDGDIFFARRRPLLDHVLNHQRAHPARPRTESIDQTTFRRSDTKRSVDRDVRAYAHPFHYAGDARKCCLLLLQILHARRKLRQPLQRFQRAGNKAPRSSASFSPKGWRQSLASGMFLSEALPVQHYSRALFVFSPQRR